MIHDPSEAPPKPRRAGEDEQLRRRMIELIGMHRTDEGQVIDHRREVRQQLADPCSALSMLCKLVRTSQQLRVPLDEGEPLSLEQLIRAGLQMVLVEERLVIEQSVLRGAPPAMSR